MSETDSIITTEYLIDQINTQRKLIRVSKLCNNFSISTVERPLDILGIIYQAAAETDKPFRFKTLAGMDFSEDILGEIFGAVVLLNHFEGETK